MITTKAVEAFKNIETPFYFYGMDLLRATLEQIKTHGLAKGYHVHFALKSNNRPRVLKEILAAGMGADCVSGGEVQLALDNGFRPEQIVFAGVGKTNKEILLGLKHDIFCFNCESVQELQVINELATQSGKKARIALRLNPNIDAHTHKYITTGLEENKFGIGEEHLDEVFKLLPKLKNLELVGIHFHIGSQIEQFEPFVQLCSHINTLNNRFETAGYPLRIINAGGGFGIDYKNPEENLIPDFERYFNLFEEHLQLKAGQELHFELGRAIIGQSGSLITRVLYLKEGQKKNFAIVDAGMTELIRPALYQAEHQIKKLNGGESETTIYEVVGPICESADTFRSDIELPTLKRGDLLAILSAGAYGEVMKSRYNLREEAGVVFSDDIDKNEL